MEAEVRSLASGSAGNATLVSTGNTRVLIDAGLPGAEMLRAIRRVGVDPSDLDAVLLTHEHADHARGVLAIWEAAPELRVYSTRATLDRAGQRNDWRQRGHPVRAGQPFEVGALCVLPFEVNHDAADPIGFRVAIGDFAMGLCTDTGRSNRHMEKALSGCRALFVEANHDRDMLEWGPYPDFLKRRVASSRGHLSNEQTAKLLGAVATRQLEQVVLLHLSETNNRPERALADVGAGLPSHLRSRLDVAPRSTPGPVYRFQVRRAPEAAKPIEPPPEQTSLFDLF